MDAEWRVTRSGYLKVIKCLPPDGPETGEAGNIVEGWKALNASTAGRCDLIRSLSGMRRELAGSTDARVLLGGKSHTFLGLYPGILEEALLSIDHNQPLYVMGGFGGAAQCVTDVLMGKEPPEFDLAFQCGKSPAYAASMAAYARLSANRPALNLPPIDYAAATSKLKAYGASVGGASSALSRANGLSQAENQMLFATASLDEAMYLILKGLRKVL